MEKVLKEIGLAVILGVMIPGIVLHGLVVFGSHREAEENQTEILFFTQPVDQKQMIRVLDRDGSALSLALEDYITGVVLAEMPASFESEALKAQAIVARTYAIRAENGKSKHEQAAVCMESACCQSFIWPEDYLQKGGSEESIGKVLSAVNDTAGLVLRYQGELIEATYFSCSGGSTEDAVAVWGTDVPYLVATQSPGEERATHYEDTAVMSVAQFLQMLGLEHQSSEPLFGTAVYTAGGGIASMEVCNQTFTGTELRSKLNLKSTAITFKLIGDDIEIHTRGYGHRVGMSQYGADAMAVEGHSYQEILTHYYRGTTIEKLSD